MLWLQRKLLSMATQNSADLACISRTLQSLGLPGSITALDRPTGLPPALLQKAEEIQAQGGVAKVQALLQEVSRVARANNDTLEEVRCVDLSLPLANPLMSIFHRQGL